MKYPEVLLFNMISDLGLSFPLEAPIISDTDNLLYLKLIGGLNQNGNCVCGTPLQDGELHHALITKRDVMGKKDSTFINHQCNVLVLHYHCHKNVDRAVSYSALCAIYGQERIDQWVRKNA